MEVVAASPAPSLDDDEHDDEAAMESGVLLGASSSALPSAGRSSASRRALRRWKCIGIASTSVLLLVVIVILVLPGAMSVFYNMHVLHAGAFAAAPWNDVPAKCFEPAYVAAVTAQLSDTCHRLNRAGVDYWLTAGSLLAVIREPNQGIFKHDTDADVAYMARDHAKAVGALRSSQMGEYYFQSRVSADGSVVTPAGSFVGRRDPPWGFCIDMFSSKIMKEKSLQTGFGRYPLHVYGDVYQLEWAVFPLRKLRGEGALAHCNIPNIPYLHYRNEANQNGLLQGKLSHAIEGNLNKQDQDLRPCVQRTAAEMKTFIRWDWRTANPQALPHGRSANDAAFFSDATFGAKNTAEALAAEKAATQFTAAEISMKKRLGLSMGQTYPAAASL